MPLEAPNLAAGGDGLAHLRDGLPISRRPAQKVRRFRAAPFLQTTPRLANCRQLPRTRSGGWGCPIFAPASVQPCRFNNIQRIVKNRDIVDAGDSQELGIIGETLNPAARLQGRAFFYARVTD